MERTITQEFTAIWVRNTWAVELRKPDGGSKLLGERKTVNGVKSLVAKHAVQPMDEIQKIRFLGNESAETIEQTPAEFF